jgi:hypothetical protein
MNRRQFLETLVATVAGAGASCVVPDEKLVPFRSNRVQVTTPDKPVDGHFFYKGEYFFYKGRLVLHSK